MPSDVHYRNSTALVTGGSSGIGRAIASELVARGVRRIAIVAHDQTKLDEAAADLRGLSDDLEVETISVDLAASDAPAEIEAHIRDRKWQIDILVNGAGLARKQNFAMNGDNDVSLRTVDVMVRSVVDLTLRFLPPMADRGSGGILNICSTAAYQPVPFTAIYAAAKAFMWSWSQAIREENIDKGVRVAMIVPGITETNLDGDGHGERRGTLDAVGIHMPREVAVAALDAYEANAAEKIVGWNNALMQGVLHVLPAATKATLIHKSRGDPEEADDIGAKRKCSMTKEAAMC